MATNPNSDLNFDPRFLRHFAVIRLETASNDDLYDVIYSIFETKISSNSNDLLEAISTTTCKIFNLIRKTLKPW